MRECDIAPLTAIRESGVGYHESEDGKISELVDFYYYLVEPIPWVLQITGEYAGHQYSVEYYAGRGPVVYRWTVFGWKRLTEAPMPLINTWRKLAAQGEDNV